MALPRRRRRRGASPVTGGFRAYPLAPTLLSPSCISFLLRVWYAADGAGLAGGTSAPCLAHQYLTTTGSKASYEDLLSRCALAGGGCAAADLVDQFARA